MILPLKPGLAIYIDISQCYVYPIWSWLIRRPCPTQGGARHGRKNFLPLFTTATMASEQKQQQVYGFCSSSSLFSRFQKGRSAGLSLRFWDSGFVRPSGPCCFAVGRCFFVTFLLFFPLGFRRDVRHFFRSNSRPVSEETFGTFSGSFSARFLFHCHAVLLSGRLRFCHNRNGFTSRKCGRGRNGAG